MLNENIIYCWKPEETGLSCWGECFTKDYTSQNASILCYSLENLININSRQKGQNSNTFLAIIMFQESKELSCQGVIVEEIFPGSNVCVNEKYLVRSKQ